MPTLLMTRERDCQLARTQRTWYQCGVKLDALQKALVHENIIQQLSKPHCLPHHQTVTVGSTLLMLRGYARSHYAALCFVNCVIEDVGGLLSELPDVDAARLNTIQTRCELCQPATVPNEHCSPTLDGDEHAAVTGYAVNQSP